MRLPGPLRRRAARLIRHVPVRIRSGPNAGRRWSLAVSGRGTRTGRYELGRFRAWERIVQPGDDVWDVGAHYGYAAMIAARRAGLEGSVCAFEPSAFNRWYLERHLAWNGIEAEVVGVALSDFEGSSSFGGHGGSVAFHLGGEGETVSVRTVSGLVAEGRALPHVVKVDVEGAEVQLLAGATQAFESARAEGRSLPLLFISIHGASLLEPCLIWARGFGYTAVVSTAIARARSGLAAWNGDPDVLFVPPERLALAEEVRREPWFSGGAVIDP